jgi:alkylation response protein AidB-like acyl-CoA dehydrogenase
VLLEDVCTVIAGDRDRAEREARMTPEVRAAASEAGLFTLAAPRQVGGRELDLIELVSTFERLGYADPAFSWSAMNSIGTGLAAAKLSEQARKPLFAQLDGPYGLAAALTYSRAQQVEGGWHIEGDWRFMTGSSDARWCTVWTLDPRSEQPNVLWMILPMDELEVTDTWLDASSMRGTGSNAVRTPGLFVPSERVVEMKQPPLIDRPLYRVDPRIMIFAPSVALVIGALRCAIDGVVELAGPKVSNAPGRPRHADSWRVQQGVCDATAAAECLSAGLANLMGELWSCAEAGTPPPPPLRARWWSMLCYLLDTARRQVSDLYSLSTSAAYATGNRVERSFRDIHAVATTFEMLPVQAFRGASGLVLLGHDPANPAF